MAVGDILRNGATELRRKKTKDDGVDIILCLFEGQFVIWDHYKHDGLCRAGQYYSSDIKNAVKGFENRK